MIVGSIDIPDDLIASITRGRCVIFAGAGVSKGRPADLPLFDELVERLIGRPPPPGEPLDRVLGRLGTRDVLIAATIRLSPHHNPIHEHLVRLFPKTGQIRIVTTNYDPHCEAAAHHVTGAAVPLYHAPALPLGRSFQGIVHVHGGIDQPDGMVLTDDDFGRAYLTDGWARRFLVDLFQNWDVLFIGYSHKDLLMDYLSRALPPSDRKRYALDRGPAEASLWSARGITVIPYGTGTDPGDFALQADAIRDLATYVGRTALEWVTTMAQWVAQGPPQEKAAQSQLAHALKHPRECRLFLDHNPDASWVPWLDDRGLLHGLVADDAVDECAGRLSHWMSHIILRAAPQVVLAWTMAKGRLSSVYWHDLAHGVHDLPDTVDRAVARRLLGILVSLAPEEAHAIRVQWLAQAVARLGFTEILIEIVKYACTSRTSFRKRLGQPAGDGTHERDLEPAFRYDRHDLHAIFEQVRPSLPACALRLFPIACEALAQRSGIHRSWDDQAHAFDADSYHRSAIEPHEQDRHMDDGDPLIDVIRDMLHLLVEQEPSWVRTWIPLALRDPAPLIRRLAVYALTILPGEDPTGALALLMAGPLGDMWCRHEVFLALKAFYGSCSEGTRRDIIQALRESTSYDPQAPEEEAAHRYYQWVSYLHTHHPSCPFAAEDVQAITARIPGIVVREYPDLVHWSRVSWGGDPSPLSDGALQALSPLELIADERSRSAASSHRDLSSYYDAISRVSGTHEGWAQHAMAAILADERRSPALCAAVLHSFGKRLSQADAFARAMLILEDSRIQHICGDLVASFLNDLIDKDPPAHVVDHITQCDAVICTLWPILSLRNLERPEPQDWLQAAIATSAGTLAEYVVASIELQCRGDEGVPPRPIPPHLRSLVIAMIADTTINGGFCRSILASQLNLFNWLDKDLAQTAVLPMFISDQPRIRAQAWHGFLSWGQVSPILARILQPAFSALIASDHAVLGDEGHRFAQLLLLAGAMIGNQCVLEWSLHPRVVANATLRHAIAGHIFSMFRDAPADVLSQHWRGWMSHYWAARIADLMQPIDAQEIAAYLQGLDDLEHVIDDAAALLARMPHPQLEHSLVLFGIHQDGIDARHPQAAATILEYLLHNEPSGWSLTSADDVLRVIAPMMDDRVRLTALVNLAIERGALQSTEGPALLAAGQRQ